MNFELIPDADPASGARPGPAKRARRGLPLFRRFLLPIALAATVFASGLAADGPATAQQGFHELEEVHDSRDAVLSDGRYQTDKPETEVKPETEPLRIPPWLVKTILWTLGAVVAGLVLFFLFNLAFDLLRDRTAFKRRREGRLDDPAKIETPVVARDREAEKLTLSEADQLAAEGRFSEAIHLLLLVAMARLRRELGPRVAPALTSREVLRLTPIPGEAADPLSRMVSLSEINHFGGRQAGEPDYRSCRDDFLRFNGLETAGA